MVKLKKQKIKAEKIQTEEQEQIQKFIKILIALVVILALVYVVTKVFIKKEYNLAQKTVTAGEINYDKLIVGNMLNQNYDEYYVFIYSGNDKNAIYYGSIIDSYMRKEKSSKAYWVDLDNSLNQKFIAKDGEKINKKATKISEFKFGKITLLKIEKNKVTKYLDDIETIKKELK